MPSRGKAVYVTLVTVWGLGDSNYCKSNHFEGMLPRTLHCTVKGSSMKKVIGYLAAILIFSLRAWAQHPQGGGGHPAPAHGPAPYHGTPVASAPNRDFKDAPG